MLLKKSLGLVLALIMTVSALAQNTPLIFKSGFVDVDGGRVWYQIVSSAKTKNSLPLLILHGGPGGTHDYLNVFKILATQRPIIFYDQLGSGHSWGGALASEYALKNPERLQSLILASPLLSTKLWYKDSRKLIKRLPIDVQKAILANETHGTTDSEAYVHATTVYNDHFGCRKDCPSDDEQMNLNVYQTMWGPSEFTVSGNLKSFNQIPKLKKLQMPVLMTGGVMMKLGQKHYCTQQTKFLI